MARREETTRMCALTRAEKPVAELIRFVLGPDDVLVPDTDAKAEGRGVWLSLNRELVAEAVKKKVFARSLKTEVKLPDDLPALTQLRLEQRYLNALGMARKAGQLTFGATKVRSLIDGCQIFGSTILDFPGGFLVEAFDRRDFVGVDIGQFLDRGKPFRGQ